MAKGLQEYEQQHHERQLRSLKRNAARPRLRVRTERQAAMSRRRRRSKSSRGVARSPRVVAVPSCSRSPARLTQLPESHFQEHVPWKPWAWHPRQPSSSRRGKGHQQQHESHMPTALRGHAGNETAYRELVLATSPLEGHFHAASQHGRRRGFFATFRPGCTGVHCFLLLLFRTLLLLCAACPRAALGFTLLLARAVFLSPSRGCSATPQHP